MINIFGDFRRLVLAALDDMVAAGALPPGLDFNRIAIEPPCDPALEPEIRRWFRDFYTIEFENYPVGLEYLPHPERVAAGAPAPAVGRT